MSNKVCTRLHFCPFYAQSAGVQRSAHGDVPVDGEQDRQPDGHSLRHVSQRVDVLEYEVSPIRHDRRLRMNDAVDDAEDEARDDKDGRIGDGQGLEQEGGDAVLSVGVQYRQGQDVAGKAEEADDRDQATVENDTEKDARLADVGARRPRDRLRRGQIDDGRRACIVLHEKHKNYREVKYGKNLRKKTTTYLSK